MFWMLDYLTVRLKLWVNIRCAEYDQFTQVSIKPLYATGDSLQVVGFFEVKKNEDMYL